MPNKSFQEFRSAYYLNFSEAVNKQFEYYEEKETWTIDEEFELLAKIFESLPLVCSYPLNKDTEHKLIELIVLIAYLPFRDSLATLAWCGSKSEEWGLAIYSIAYEIYVEDRDLPSFDAAKVIVTRMDILNRVSSLQSLVGNSI